MPDSDDILDAVDAWHYSDDRETNELHEWLGLTWEQYAAWVESGKLPDGYKVPVRS